MITRGPSPFSETDTDPDPVPSDHPAMKMMRNLPNNPGFCSVFSELYSCILVWSSCWGTCLERHLLSVWKNIWEDSSCIKYSLNLCTLWGWQLYFFFALHVTPFMLPLSHIPDCSAFWNVSFGQNRDLLLFIKSWPWELTNWTQPDGFVRLKEPQNQHVSYHKKDTLL